MSVESCARPGIESWLVFTCDNDRTWNPRASQQTPRTAYRESNKAPISTIVMQEGSCCLLFESVLVYDAAGLGRQDLEVK
jgi:hypothetical protein